MGKRVSAWDVPGNNSEDASFPREAHSDWKQKFLGAIFNGQRSVCKEND